ncbi:hypothetical protein OUZ56_027642 [Daphnia magna]|uniref:Uncharacterized protein n=1 Tax=Daphnia magna TaxID=35525 RepID=A0ABR0B1H6_9CRUS|nr:hypothetical protein OUZ56_027642 [Daphnia magna]
MMSDESCHQHYRDERIDESRRHQWPFAARCKRHAALQMIIFNGDTFVINDNRYFDKLLQKPGPISLPTLCRRTVNTGYDFSQPHSTPLNPTQDSTLSDKGTAAMFYRLPIPFFTRF